MTEEECRKAARGFIALMEYAASQGFAIGMFQGEKGVVNSAWPKPSYQPDQGPEGAD
jgi:hypothetical protein